MNAVILDAGNSEIKARTSSLEANWPHALHQITQAELDDIVRRHNRNHGESLPPGYAVVNGEAFAYGDAALARGMNNRRQGAARYTKQYYGVIAAIAIAELYSRSADLALFASHSPRDSQYADNLIDAALGTWNVRLAEREIRIGIESAGTFDEPIGGLMNVILSQDGKGYARHDLMEGESLVIDIGGGTTDFQGVQAEGKLNYNVSFSVPLGINQVEQDVADSIRSSHAEFFRNTNDVPARKIREAIRTGVFAGGGRKLDISNEISEAAFILLNQIRDVYFTRAGGKALWDTIVLTGGGSAMLHDRLVNDVLDHERVILAESDLDSLHLANVRGGLKLYRFYEAMGAI